MSLPDLPSRREVVERVRRDGHRVVAVLPYHYPRALLRAYGFHPIELWGPPHVSRDEGGRHFQPYTCDIVVRAASFLTLGGLKSVDAVLVPHTCDALQGMGSVVGDFLQPDMPVLTFYLPRGNRSSDRLFLVEELRRLAEHLTSITGMEPGSAEWEVALALEESADRALAGLYEQRSTLAVTDREFYTVVRAREYLPPEDFVGLVTSLPAGSPAADGIGLMLSGIIAEPMELFDHINKIGAQIVADDLACGARRLYPFSNNPDPFARLAERLLGNPPDPTRGSPIEWRTSMLEARMAATGARGLLIYDVKFCEPELFDVPLIRSHLRAAGYATLHVEVELGETLTTQAVTRLEAFVETLQ